MANGEAQGAPGLERYFLSSLGLGLHGSRRQEYQASEQQRGLWRNAANVRLWRGFLTRPWGVENFTYNSDRLEAPLSQYTIASAAFDRWEMPLYIESIWSPTDGNVVMVVVTNKNAWIGNTASGWTLATPTYEVGTVDGTAATKVVTKNAGSPPTNWQTRHISPGQIMVLDPGGGNEEWHAIDTVDNESQITLLTNLANTHSNASYTIYRCWGGRTDLGTAGVLTQLFNADTAGGNLTLYLAGSYLGGDGPAVLKINDILSPGSQTATYLYGRYAYEAGIDTNSTLYSIAGLQLMADGRILIACDDNEYDARLRYSSPTNQGDWTSAANGAGAIDVIGDWGPITALGRLGETFTIHYVRHIEMGYPTGLLQTPLETRPSGADVGCIAPRSLLEHGNSEFYVGSNFRVYRFDGQFSGAISSDVDTADRSIPTLEGASLQMSDVGATRWLVCAAIDVVEEEYLLLIPPETRTLPQSALWQYSIRDDRWMKAYEVDGRITAISRYPLEQDFNAGNRRYLGLESVDDPNATDTLLFGMNHATTHLLTPVDDCWAVSSWLDFSLPGVEKVIDHIDFYYSQNFGANKLLVSLSADGTTLDETVTLTLVNTSNDEEKIVRAVFSGTRPYEQVALVLKWQNAASNPEVKALWSKAIIYYRPLHETQAFEEVA